MNAANRPDLKQGPLSVTTRDRLDLAGSWSVTISRSERPSSRSVSASAISTVWIASRWFWVGETCQPSSYFDQ